MRNLMESSRTGQKGASGVGGGQVSVAALWKKTCGIFFEMSLRQVILCVREVFSSFRVKLHQQLHSLRPRSPKLDNGRLGKCCLLCLVVIISVTI